MRSVTRCSDMRGVVMGVMKKAKRVNSFHYVLAFGVGIRQPPPSGKAWQAAYEGDGFRSSFEK
jgi:hypothetical protein